MKKDLKNWRIGATTDDGRHIRFTFYGTQREAKLIQESLFASNPNTQGSEYRELDHLIDSLDLEIL